MACWSCRKSRNWCRDTVKQLAAAASMQALTRRGTYRHIGVTPASRRAVTARSVTSRMLSTKDANCRDLSAGDSVSITSYVAATLPRSTRKPTTTSGGDSSRATATAAMVAKPSPLRLQCTHTRPDSLLVGYTHPAVAAPQRTSLLTRSGRFLARKQQASLYHHITCIFYAQEIYLSLPGDAWHPAAIVCLRTEGGVFRCGAEALVATPRCS